MNELKKNQKKSLPEVAGEDLFSFAIDREDIKRLMTGLPEDSKRKPHTVDYELQILKIILVGWSISFCMQEKPFRTEILEIYWNLIREFSLGVSETTGLMIGQDIDYFQTLKDRLDMYVGEMTKKTDAPEPAVVIGPAFARQCGDEKDVFTVMIGSRMCISTIGSVKEYLETLKLA